MKYVLFAVALIFAMMFVTSTLFSFIYAMIHMILGEDVESPIAVHAYYSTGIGIIGWIIATLTLVLVDESDGINFDDELDVAS